MKNAILTIALLASTMVMGQEITKVQETRVWKYPSIGSPSRSLHKVGQGYMFHFRDLGYTQISVYGAVHFENYDECLTYYSKLLEMWETQLPIGEKLQLKLADSEAIMSWSAFGKSLAIWNETHYTWIGKNEIIQILDYLKNNPPQDLSTL